MRKQILKIEVYSKTTLSNILLECFRSRMKTGLCFSGLTLAVTSTTYMAWEGGFIRQEFLKLRLNNVQECTGECLDFCMK